MLSVTLQIAETVSFVALLFLIWRVSKRPRWRIRAVVYGWAAVFLWAFFWAILLPMWFKGVLDSHTMLEAFPDGTIAMAALAGGWSWPLTIVAISSYFERRQQRTDHIITMGNWGLGAW